MGKAVAFSLFTFFVVIAIAAMVIFLVEVAQHYRHRRAYRCARWEEHTELEEHATDCVDVQVIVSIQLVAKWGHHCEVLNTRTVDTVPLEDDGMALASLQDRARRMAAQANLAEGR